jgi:hypothetical protein
MAMDGYQRRTSDAALPTMLRQEFCRQAGRHAHNVNTRMSGSFDPSGHHQQRPCSYRILGTADVRQWRDLEMTAYVTAPLNKAGAQNSPSPIVADGWTVMTELTTAIVWEPLNYEL